LEQTIDATELVEAIGEIKHGANLVVIDACRVAAMFECGDPRPVGSQTGLARVPAPRGTMVAFSTRPGHVARDGDRAMSIYARHFHAHPGAGARTARGSVSSNAYGRGVVAETRNRQVPWESSDLNGELCFRPNADGRCRRSPPG